MIVNSTIPRISFAVRYNVAVPGLFYGFYAGSNRQANLDRHERNQYNLKSIFLKHPGVFAAILLTTYLVLSITGCSNYVTNNAPPSEPEPSTQTLSKTSTTAQVNKGVISINDLPVEARETIKLIKNGGPFPYSKDGSIFYNYEGLLPNKPAGYYHEYTVITPGSPGRGSRRIVVGSKGEFYYTDDHYSTFRLVVE